MSLESAETNRRRTPRRTGKKSTKVICLKGTWGMGANLARSLLDLSTDGARLVVATPLDKGQEVELSLEAAWQQRPLKVVGNVIWCMSIAAGDYCIGVHFQKTLSFYEVQAYTQS